MALPSAPVMRRVPGASWNLVLRFTRQIVDGALEFCLVLGAAYGSVARRVVRTLAGRQAVEPHIPTRRHEEGDRETLVALEVEDAVRRRTEAVVRPSLQEIGV